MSRAAGDPPPFDDGKEAGALRTIGEVCAALDLKPHVVRYWEEQFDALRPLKRSGNRRYYRPEDVALVRRIDRLVNREGYTIRGARAAVAQAPDAGDPLAELRSVRDALARALDR